MGVLRLCGGARKRPPVGVRMASGFDWKALFPPGEPSTVEAGPQRGVGDELTFLRSFLDACPLGIYMLNSETRMFSYANSSLEAILQYSSRELRTLTFDVVVAAEDHDRVAEMFRRRRLGDPTLPHSYEVLVTNRYGEKRVVMLYPDLVKLDGALLGAVRDITGERIMADPVLYNQRVDSLASLAGGFANEFNNLLGVISGYTQLALSRVDNCGDVTSPLHTISLACQKAAALVTSILTFARRGSHGLESVDITALLRSLASAIRTTTPASITIDTSSVEEGVRIRGDVTQLEQAFMNILLNAVEAMCHQTGTITVSTLLDHQAANGPLGLPAGPYVLIRLDDSGPGIPLELQPKVLEPFFTTKNPTKHPGLGLSTSYGVIRSHGGALEVSSSQPGGTSVRVWLPRDRDPSELVPAVIERGLRPKRSHLVYIVDDQAMVAELLQEVLLSAGYQVLTETQPQVALQTLLDGTIHPCVLIVDLMMPELDGRSLILKLRQAGFSRPVVVVSGFAMPSRGDEQMNLQVQGFIKKPFQNQDVLAVLESALSDVPPPPEVSP